MIKTIFVIIIVLHGLIHLIGYRKSNEKIEKEINNRQSQRTTWLICCILFLLVAIGVYFNMPYWWLAAMIAVIISQTLIIRQWRRAKPGTVLNLIILIVSVLTLTSITFENRYRADVEERLRDNNLTHAEILRESDLNSLPECVRKYIRYTGCIGKPMFLSVKAVFEGKMRGKGKDYFPFRSEQYNYFLKDPARFFFMKGKMSGLTVPGYHRYVDATATMDVRLFGIFPVMQASGEVMNKTETVTLFNDMCFLAPTTLISKRISWEELSDTSVRAKFMNHNILISAELYFNRSGQLVNFVSYDRTEIGDMKEYKFETPVSSYQAINGFNLMKTGEAIWHYPDGPFSYGEFNLVDLKYK